MRNGFPHLQYDFVLKRILKSYSGIFTSERQRVKGWLIRGDAMKRSKSYGITLVELLIVIAIIGLLLQLVLPAVQSARETARQMQCKNNVRQLAMACLLHSNTHGYFPTGGWNSAWVGDPNRGFSRKQPGGWAYNILPYLEQEELHNLGFGLPQPDRLKAAAQLYGTALPIFTCTSRRLARPQPFIFSRKMMNADMKELARLKQAGRSDYAGNIGIVLPKKNFALGPSSYEEGDRWVNGKDPKTSWIASTNYGIIYQRSEVTPAMITDGLSHTFVLGEKFIPFFYIKTKSKTHADDQSMYVGFSYDNNRACKYSTPPTNDRMVQVPNSLPTTLWRFGGAHPTGFNMACCDGSVHHVDYGVDIIVFSAMSTRNLGEKRRLD